MINFMICGDGYLGTSIKKVLDELGIGHEVLSKHFQYAHKDYENFNLIASKFAEKIDEAAFLNVSGPSSVEESEKSEDLYIVDPVNQIKAHFAFFREHDINPTYIYISSASVYGNLERGSEEDEVQPISKYAEGKLRAELELQIQSQSYLGNIIILRVTSVFSEDLQSRIFGRIVTKISKKQELIFSGTGDEVRDFIQIKDLVHAMLCIVKSQNENLIKVYNVGSGNLTSIRELVDIALSAYAKSHSNSSVKHVTFDGTIRPWDPKVISINTRHIQSVGFVPSFSSKSDLEAYFMNAFSRSE